MPQRIKRMKTKPTTKKSKKICFFFFTLFYNVFYILRFFFLTFSYCISDIVCAHVRITFNLIGTPDNVSCLPLSRYKNVCIVSTAWRSKTNEKANQNKLLFIELFSSFLVFFCFSFIHSFFLFHYDVLCSLSVVFCFDFFFLYFKWNKEDTKNE